MDYDNYDIEDFACEHSFQQYCKGEDPEAIAFWEDWTRKNPARREIIDAARKLVMILNAGQEKRADQLSRLQKGLQQRQILENKLDIKKSESYPFRRAAKYISGIAATIIIAAGLYFLQNKRYPKDEQVSRYYNQSKSFRTGKSERKTIVLPDGTFITLNHNSFLLLPADFGKQVREVHLRGEGFFDVKQDPVHPFLVHTNTVTVKVLGTTFNLKAHPAEAGITETTLLKGIVEVELNQGSQKKYLLRAGQKIRTVAHTGKSAIAAGNIQAQISPLSKEGVLYRPAETSWTRSRIELSNEKLSDIALKLGKWYGIRIEFGDENVKDLRYSGTFESETIAEALEALQLSYPFNFKAENEKIIITH